jgi:AmmeMemoRadiSam system protein A
MSSLASSEKKSLLKIARKALVLAIERGESLETFGAEDEASQGTTAGGAFVTLRRGRRLRGCIGQILPDAPLAEVVAYCAKAAALSDPRFAPLGSDELPEIEIEISVLSEPDDIKPSEIDPGRHGLIVTSGAQRGLLLPQVAREYGWPAQRFLEETCVKGGMKSDAWKSDSTRIQAFTAEVFSESDTAGEESTAPAHNGRYSSST